MERLTCKQIVERERECVSRQQCDRDCAKCDLVMEASDILDAYDHMIELLVAEEQGLLVRLPCKVGDTVYICHKESGIIRDQKVRTFFLGHPSHRVEDRKMKMIRVETFDIPFSEFGKTVFLTREKAEAALAKDTNVPDKEG